MNFLITFAEGLLSFISPCLLPLLPVYVSYLAGSIDGEQAGGNRVLRNAIGFVLGFTVLFVLMGAAAGTIGRFASQHARLLSLVGGGILIVLGLNYIEVLRIPFLSNSRTLDYRAKTLNMAGAFLFGAVFALGWTPCIGAFLGSALMMAAQAKTALLGVALLATYSLGLGVPFILSAVLIKQLSGAFSFIKKHYRVINIVSGALLIVLGVLMMLGLFAA